MSVKKSGLRSCPSACPRRVATIDIDQQPAGAGPERLVGLGFRFWMQGRADGNIACWERAWSLYSGMFGPARARIAVGELSGWVAALDTKARRRIEVGRDGCGAFCRDECIAISMIAACQHNACPALRACAFALIETSEIDGVAGHAQRFADTMTSLDQVLSPASIVAAPAIARPINQLPV